MGWQRALQCGGSGALHLHGDMFHLQKKEKKKPGFSAAVGVLTQKRRWSSEGEPEQEHLWLTSGLVLASRLQPPPSIC